MTKKLLSLLLALLIPAGALLSCRAVCSAEAFRREAAGISRFMQNHRL